MNNCPLCLHQQVTFWLQDKKRCFYRCANCQLIFADKQSLLSPTQEKAIYQQHENNLDDIGYRRFLSRLATPMLKKLAEQSLGEAWQGLDFGCGPGPALAAIFSEAGFQMSVYDPYFAADKRVLDKKYDFVTCTEAIEHFYTPHKEWALLLNLVRDGGMLGIMTKLARGLEDFARWHYKNDPTHVSFFSKETFLYLAKRDGLSIEFVADDAILLMKKRENHDS